MKKIIKHYSMTGRLIVTWGYIVQYPKFDRSVFLVSHSDTGDVYTGIERASVDVYHK